MELPVMPPVKPMLAKAVTQIPEGPLSYEPKWEGFRAMIFRDGEEVEIGSRNGKSMTGYFPELIGPIMASLPSRWVIDGEIILVAATTSPASSKPADPPESGRTAKDKCSA